MGKDPAVLWYWSDWNSGTSLFTRHLKGCYMDLLHAQFNNGRLSLEDIKTILGSDFGSSWPTLQKKFSVDQSGHFFNERLEREKEKRSNWVESRRNNLKKTHMADHMNNHMTGHMENRNRNDNTIKKKRKEFIPPSFDEFKQYCKENGFESIAQRAYDGYSAAEWHKANGNKILNWKQTLQNGWFRDENKDRNSKNSYSTPSSFI